MAASPVEFVLADLKAKYEERPAAPEFTRLYDDQDFGHMFAVLHDQLNSHFESINGRAETTHHYWAESSREMLALLNGLKDDLHSLSLAGIDVALDDRYQDAIERCRPWLAWSHGSTVPDDFEAIQIIKYEPAFSRPSVLIKLQKRSLPVELQMVGEGSYATVFSYVDPDYGTKFAVKRAKPQISDRDLERFKQEFEVLKRLSFPYIVEVYKYDDDRNEYRMEYCDETLREYIDRRNNQLAFSPRKRIALQFLYGLNYIHSQDLLHRDLSFLNILLRVYTSGAVQVKLSDFGLVKDLQSEFTQTQTEMRGTIRDPHLGSFKDYSVVNEMYSVGWILSYIFTGRKSLPSNTTPVGMIVRQCTSSAISDRYQCVLDLISDVEHLDVEPTAASG